MSTEVKVDPAILAKIADPRRIAEELCSVQPMPSDAISKLRDDPMANHLLNNFLKRNAS